MSRFFSYTGDYSWYIMETEGTQSIEYQRRDGSRHAFIEFPLSRILSHEHEELL